MYTTRRLKVTARYAMAALLVCGATAASADHSARISAVAQAPFEMGYPTAETLSTLEQELFFQRAVQVYHWALPMVNMYSMKETLAEAFGSGYNTVAIWKDRLDAQTVILTPNGDVVYGMGFLDLATDGAMVIDVPPGLQALIDDFWHRPIQGPTIDGHTYYGDIGLPGPDKGKGGKYLVLPPNYTGDIPDGYYVYQSETNGAFLFLRGLITNEQDARAVAQNMERIRVYPLDAQTTAKPMRFPNASGLQANFLAPSDASYFDVLNRFIQSEVVDPADHYMRGMAAALGIIKGKSFEPTDDQKPLLELAAKTAWKMAKVVAFNQFEKQEGAKWYADRQWLNHVRTYDNDFTRSMDNLYYQVDGEHYTNLDGQLHMFINAFSMSAGMFTSIPGVGAKFLEAYRDADGHYLLGDNTYALTLPKGIPANLFWSITLYDANTASMLETSQAFPLIGSKDDIAYNEDGSVTFYFGPKPPAGKERNWVETVPGKGWYSLLRLYGPEQGFFDQSWVPGDFMPID